MTRAELSELVANEVDGISIATAKDVVKTVFESIATELVENPEDEIVIQNFGKFFVKLQKGRTAKHFQTGKPIEIPDKMVVKFKAAKALKDDVA